MRTIRPVMAGLQDWKPCRNVYIPIIVGGFLKAA